MLFHPFTPSVEWKFLKVTKTNVNQFHKHNSKLHSLLYIYNSNLCFTMVSLTLEYISWMNEWPFIPIHIMWTSVIYFCYVEKSHWFGINNSRFLHFTFFFILVQLKYNFLMQFSLKYIHLQGCKRIEGSQI